MAEMKLGNVTYTVGVVLATESIRLKTRLLKMVGGGVERLPEILSGRGLDATPEQKAKSDAASVAALTDILSKIEEDTVVELMETIVGYATVKRPSGDVESLTLDADFTENKDHLYPVMIFVLKEVLSDFFSGRGELGKQLKKLLV